jgi:hypothetical protein
MWLTGPFSSGLTLANTGGGGGAVALQLDFSITTSESWFFY